MDPGQFETPWVEYTKRMDPEKYVKFVQCFDLLIQETNLKEATSMLSIGIGKFNRNDWFKWVPPPLPQNIWKDLVLTFRSWWIRDFDSGKLITQD